MENQSNAAGQADKRAAMIAEAAYFAAEKRNFQPGGELEDWLAAEHFVDLELERAKQAPITPSRARKTAKKQAKKGPARKKVGKAAAKKVSKVTAKKAAGTKTAAKKKVAKKATTKKSTSKKSAKR